MIYLIIFSINLFISIFLLIKEYKRNLIKKNKIKIEKDFNFDKVLFEMKNTYPYNFISNEIYNHVENCINDKFGEICHDLKNYKTTLNMYIDEIIELKTQNEIKNSQIKFIFEELKKNENFNNISLVFNNKNSISYFYFNELIILYDEFKNIDGQNDRYTLNSKKSIYFRFLEYLKNIKIDETIIEKISDPTKGYGQYCFYKIFNL